MKATVGHWRDARRWLRERGHDEAARRISECTEGQERGHTLELYPGARHEAVIGEALRETALGHPVMEVRVGEIAT